MNAMRARRLTAALSGSLLVWVVLRRKTALLRRVPDLLEEHIVLPVGDLMRDAIAAGQDHAGSTPDRITRKVGRNRKISVGGKLYGPLEPELVGRQVEVEEREGRLVVYAGADEVGSFERQDGNR